ncbi:MAG: hypothetical protein WBA22_11095 [Candidatus Methanofastidiosia archaeon]
MRVETEYVMEGSSDNRGVLWLGYPNCNEFMVDIREESELEQIRGKAYRISMLATKDSAAHQEFCVTTRACNYFLNFNGIEAISKPDNTYLHGVESKARLKGIECNNEMITGTVVGKKEFSLGNERVLEISLYCLAFPVLNSVSVPIQGDVKLKTRMDEFLDSFNLSMAWTDLEIHPRFLDMDPRQGLDTISTTESLFKGTVVDFDGLDSHLRGEKYAGHFPQLARPEEHFEGKMTGVAYDTAWVARITDNFGKLLFPECVCWLLENQKSDGSWGCQIMHYHDRVLSTLSAVMALREIDGQKYQTRIERGEEFLWENIHLLEKDSYRLIGSELLLPSLIEQAESMGLNVPSQKGIYQKEKRAKLEKIDKSLWYSPLTTLSFSLEFLGDDVDIGSLCYAQLSNGSVANSPSATAFFLNHRRDERAVGYLKEILSLTQDGSVMTVFPIDVFEYGWTLYNLMLAGLYSERFAEICDFLYRSLGKSGVGCSSESPVADADDTAVVLKVLHDMGYPVDAQILEEYDKGDYFLTFNFELDPSVSTNIHVLDFYSGSNKIPNSEEKIERIVRFLKQKMNGQGFWVDKWHVSPYYPTGHAVLALCDIDQSLAEKAVDWILNSQNENGTWGVNSGTAEETSYALQALMYYHSHVDRIDLERLSKSFSFLGQQRFDTVSLDAAGLWIGKVLYTPIQALWSSIVSAQLMGRARNPRELSSFQLG